MKQTLVLQLVPIPEQSKTLLEKPYGLQQLVVGRIGKARETYYQNWKVGLRPTF